MAEATLEKTSEMVAESQLRDAVAPASLNGGTGSQFPQYTSTETYSKQILGKSEFELYGLSVKGTKSDPTPPWHVAPGQAPDIIDTDEEMWVGLHIYFDHSPLTRLLMCLGVAVCVCFSFEGFGRKTAERDLLVKIKTTEGRFKYWIGTKVTPQELELTSGFYKVAATVEIGPLTHKCGQYVFGYGFIGEQGFQVAQQPNL